MKKLKIKQKSNLSGFTLVELVIVIAIVIILSVISVPIYRGYIDKAKWAEGYALLGSIISAQKAYYSEYGNFLEYNNGGSFLRDMAISGLDPRGNKYFTWFFIGDVDWTDSKKFFTAGVRIPNELVTSGIYLKVRYNINGGTSFYENSSGVFR